MLWPEQQHRAGRVVEDKASDMADGFWAGWMGRFAWPQNTPIADDNEVDGHGCAQAHDLLFGFATQRDSLNLVGGGRATRPAGAKRFSGCCQDFFSLLLFGLGHLREEFSTALAHTKIALAHAFHFMAGAGVNDVEQHEMQISGIEQRECPLRQPLSIGAIKAA
jgi:hypothetical protein